MINPANMRLVTGPVRRTVKRGEKDRSLALQPKRKAPWPLASAMLQSLWFARLSISAVLRAAGEKRREPPQRLRSLPEAFLLLSGSIYPQGYLHGVRELW
jgi:hypothetical protein